MGSMHYRANPNRLQEWVNVACLANLSYFRTRRELWDSLTQIIRESQGVDGTVVMSVPLFISLKSALTCKNDQLNDDKRLAFDTGIMQIQGALLQLGPGGLPGHAREPASG